MRRKNIIFNIVLLVSFFFSTSSYALSDDTSPSLSLPLVRIGVLAYRPKLQTLEQWRPLAELLKTKLPDCDFVIEALTYSEMSDAMAKNSLDFVLTNSSNYIYLKHHFQLSSPLATLAIEENGVKTTHFGGVIFTRSDNDSIHALKDIKGKKVAVVSGFSLGGYQMQAYELYKNHINFPQDITLLQTGIPHDNVVKSVLSRTADVGFVRTGVLEEMAKEHLISLDKIKIIQAPNTPKFPVLLSTALYPEWPLSALPHVNENLARKVVAVLFRLEEDQTATKSMQIFGFNIPANYVSLEHMLRTMRFPPFDETPLFDLKDIWDNYRLFLILLIGFSLVLLGYGLFYLWNKNNQLEESEFLYTKLSEHTQTMHWEVNPKGLYTYVSPNIKTLLGFTPEEIIGKLFFYDLCPLEDRDLFIQKVYNRFETKGEYYHHERRILKKNGEIAWISVYGMPLLDHHGHLLGYRGSNTDITDQKITMDELKESEERFKVLHNASFGGIFIHEQGMIVECNEGLSKLSGYTMKELIGMDGLLLLSPTTRNLAVTHIQNNYETPYEAELLHKNGTLFPVRVEGRRIPHKGKEVRVVEFRDITEEKKAQEKLELAAKVFETAREAIVITNADESIIDVNDAFCHITGYSREDILGKTPRVLSSGKHTKEFYTSMWQNIVQKGHWYGEIWNKRKNGEVYAELISITALGGAHGVAQHYISLFSDITTIKQHEHQLEYIAHHDALTNLPNRLLFADRLYQGMVQTKRRGQLLVVAYLDLDGFKTINDSYGHEVGDQLLVALSAQMKNTLREGDTLARMGGDEFVAVFQDVKSVEDTLPMLKRLLDAAAISVTIESIDLQVSASLGVTFYPQSEELEADQLLRQADHAMYQAKLAGKNCYHIFDSIQDRSVRDFHENIQHIQYALCANEFVLYYQPKVNMRTGAIMGVEALIRWNHPERGILPPCEFLPIIENHPLAVNVGVWVINTALQQISLWQDAGLKIPISVNVGARQLQESGFIESLQASLAAYPSVNPSLLSLEIIETSALEDLARVSLLMKECLFLGVTFAMDDFGTGYSSLTYLKQLPVNLLKIDQSFVRDMLEDPDDLSILKGVLGLATAFNTGIIAEGVESIEHGEMLLQLGCELAQGYGIARPMPADQIPHWVSSWKPYPSWLTILPIESKHFHLLLAIVKHRAWFKPIENYILNKTFLPHHSQTHQCDFGRWIETNELSRYDKAQINTIKQLHIEFHTLTDELCTLQSLGKHEEAVAGLEELKAVSHRMCAMLIKLSYTKSKLFKEQKYA